MKSLTVALLLFSTCICCAYSQTLKWEQSNGPKGNDYLFGCDSVLFASNSADVFRSLDHGATWTLTEKDRSPISNVFSSASDGKYIFVGLFSGAVISSINNGDSWVWPDTENALPSEARALLLTSSYVFAGTDFNGIYRLTGREGKWQDVNIGQMSTANITALAEWHGHIFAASYYSPTLLSDDNGDHWSPIVISPSDSFAYQLAANNDYVFAGTMDGELYRSMDTGKTWIPLTYGAGGIAKIAVDGDTIIVSTWNSGLIRSTNNGDSWVSPNTGMVTINYAPFVESLNGSFFAMAENGDYESTNSGLTWQGQVGPDDLTVYSLASIGPVLFASTGSVYRSTDSGSTWNVCGLIPPAPGYHYSPVTNAMLSFRGTLYAACEGGYGIYRSTDSGATWIPSENGVPFDGEGQVFVSSLVSVGEELLAVQADTLYASTDSGFSWQPRSIFQGTPVPMLSIGGILLTQISVPPRGTLGGTLCSTDGGRTWKNMPDSILNEFSQEFSIATSIGSEIFVGVMGATGNLYRSFDSGATWTTIPHPGTGVSGITASSSLLYLFSWIGRGTSWFYSTDLGNDWQLIADSIPCSPQVLTVNDGYVFAGANCAPDQTIGGVWRYPIQLPLQVQNNSALPPIIAEVYPNPLTSSSTLRYSLDRSCEVSITLFDPIGRIVSRPLTSQMQNAGEHEVTLDARNLSPGIFECRVVAGEGEATTKLVVVR